MYDNVFRHSGDIQAKLKVFIGGPKGMPSLCAKYTPALPQMPVFLRHR